MEISRKVLLELEGRLREDRLPFIQALVGPRQVGKSTGLEQIAARWPGPVVMDSADSPIPHHADWIEQLWNQARLRFQQGGPPVLLVLDEVQKVIGWSEAVKKLFDQDRHKNNLRVVLLGSASLDIDKGLSESLLGRFELMKIFHWSAGECKQAFEWSLEEYLCFGGYPASAMLIHDSRRWQQFIQNSILEPILSRDILPFHVVRNPALFRQTLQLAISSPAQVVSYTKLLGQLQEKGNSSTIKGYLEVLEKAFLVRLIPKYSERVLSVRSSSPKIIPLCPALAHAWTDPLKVQSDPTYRGLLVESLVGAKLARQSQELFYWSEGDHEVDFVLKDADDILAIEVKSGRSKRTRSLSEFQKKFPLAKILVLADDMLERFLLEDDFKLDGSVL